MSVLDNNRVILVKYEDLLLDSSKELKRIVLALGRKMISDQAFDQVSKAHSFTNIKSKNQTNTYEMSFLRKGRHGDWKNHFSREACELFHAYGGEALIQLGYEADANWKIEE
jgi:hypothetical protein